MRLSKLQLLTNKRNWAHYMLMGMHGGLLWLRKEWPNLDIQPAVYALLSIQEGVDAAWWDRKLEEAERKAVSELV